MNEDAPKGRVLIIAGSDSGGGAGIQADIKAVTAFGGYASTAITALTAQNTTGVHDVFPVPVDFIRKQIRVVLDDIGADSIKTGMLHSSDVIRAVAGELRKVKCPLVIDPVMVAKGGHRLLQEEAVSALREELLPLATMVTPNIPEAGVLAGHEIESEEGMIAAGKAILGLGAGAALIKGGHRGGDVIVDILVTPDGPVRYTDKRIETRHTHGTGCTLASAIAAGLARGKTLQSAIPEARAYVQEAIRTAPGLGKGHGPLNHACTFDR